MTTSLPDSCPAPSSKLVTMVAHGWFSARNGMIGSFLLLLLSATGLQAQWLKQTFTLKPGWNAIFTHVDASYVTLDSLVPEAGAVAEIWLWKPTFSTIQFVTTPYTNATASSQWAVWTSVRGDTDTLTALVGNGAYLVNNRNTNDFVWSVMGRPVPPTYQWTTTGLNFLGFPTPSNAAPSFSTYLTPAPSLDLSKTLQNQAHAFRYGGGNLGPTNPVEVVSFTASTTPVTRGQAFWVRGSTNYYNHYYGPVEVSLQNTAGIQYRDTLGTYGLRLKNVTASSRTVTLSLVASDTPPTNQTLIVAMPQLLVRGELSTTTLNYDYAVLAGQQFTLAPQGQAGSELQVVLGLNRTLMTGAAGSLYAGILRITDTGGLQQTDIPVSATVPSASGLWVGSATVNKVGEYLKTYAKVDTTQTDQTTQINTAAAAAGLPPNGVETPGAVFVAHETNVSRVYSAVASSADGRTLVAAAATNGALYVSQDYGTNWTVRDTNRSWAELVCSADGSVMAATVFNGAIYLSSNYGSNWAATASGTNGWVGLALSADGTILAAVASGALYTSVNRGANWLARTNTGPLNWSSVAMSMDGTNLVASVNPGQIYLSSDGGGTWRTQAFSAKWSAVASSASGTNLIAAVNPGLLYTSTNAGASWTARATTNNWNSVATSADGKHLAATVLGGKLYTSDDAGATWAARDQTRDWDDIASSGDGTRLVAVVKGGAIYTLSRTFASYTVDQASGLVISQSGFYLTTGVNTNLAKVASNFPLRLILHLSATNRASLLQHVFIGKGLNSTNTVIASRESLLDPAQLASARRITAAHLPFSRTNAPWGVTGFFSPGYVLSFTVNELYNDQMSNPFLHTFHPDHDNLDAKFKTVQPRGVESYDIKRTIQLTFTTPGTDFNSLTSSAQSRTGLYAETMTLGAQGSASRNFYLSGTFTLQLISPIATLTTP